jgi:AbrB family looped-hinge helix DNA binding protein
MAQNEKADITILSEKGQVVIPQAIRKKLGLEPKTKLLVYGYEDAVILKKLQVPDAAKELQALYKKVDKRIAEHGELTDQQVNQVIQDCRKNKQPRK